ncbi:MAG: Fumonisin B1 esterase [Pseudomonas citronellolis]|nr:MAG: Fumonisin B1 esterase [Pseudomonas citronellolis]
MRIARSLFGAWATMALLGVCLSGWADQSVTPVTAHIADGSLLGTQVDDVQAFKGIPFAAAPVGALRWRAPQPVAAWRGVRPAQTLASDCMQQPMDSRATPGGTSPAEDCLYLNLWRPTTAKAPLPVLVWIYGGGFVNGGASASVYDGAALARQGILFLTFNYRVGRFGFFLHPALEKAAPAGEAVGNYGFMDQLAALRWVQRNIAAFGGDPHNVTLIGESAGGASVHALLTSPQARGLFARAVIQSGGDGRILFDPPAVARHAALAFSRGLGIADTDPNTLDKLRGLTAQQVTDGLNMRALFAPAGTVRTFSMPITDGQLAVDVPQAYHHGDFAHVPVMLGATSADLFGADGAMLAGAREVAGALAAQGVPTWYYRFGYLAEAQRGSQRPGALHASEIPYFFDNLALVYGERLTARDRQAGQTASGYLLNFVRSGDPNGAGLPAWPVFQTERPARQELDMDGGAHTVSD